MRSICVALVNKRTDVPRGDVQRFVRLLLFFLGGLFFVFFWFFFFAFLFRLH